MILHLVHILIGVGKPGKRKKGESAVEIRKYTPKEITQSFVCHVKVSYNITFIF